MTPRRISLLVALIAMSPAAMVLAQSSPPAQDTSPSSASSPSQRDATQSNAQESMPNSGTSPSAASTPSQQQAVHTASKQSMKDCIAKQQQNDSGISKDDAKKACKAQLKGNSG
jgi:hypothetical protein